MSDKFQPPVTLMNGRYEIREILGRGAMAVVYLGWNVRIQKLVAVKFLHQQVFEDPDNLDNPYTSFKREIEALIALESCENIIKILDYDLDNDPQFIIMDYMAGGTAEDRKSEFLDLSPQDRLSRVSQVLEEVIAALECSHQKSIVHRDIKPSNIFFDDRGRAYLGDFGIAKNLLFDSGFSQSASVLAPVKYMAPEAIDGDVTERSDQYSLACVIYELLTGQQVFTADSLIELNKLILNEAHTRITETKAGREYSDAVANVLDKALSKHPQDRYPSVRKFGEAFKTAIRMSELNTSPKSILEGRYKILEPIGAGGMGVVHLAYDEKVNENVAIKFLSFPKDEKNSQEMFERFQAEIAALTQLNPYDYIVDIKDFGTEGDTSFVIMEYMEGGDLYDRVLDYLRMDVSERLSRVAQLVREICNALENSHENGIIHRDIKLRNILFNRKGEAHLADFGIAKNLRRDENLTQAGMIVGTINYMAPEAIEGKVIDMSDQYSLACAVYEVLTGQRAFDGTTVIRLIHTISTVMPPRINKTAYGIDYSNEIADVLEKALSKKPQDRYSSIRAFSKAFEAAVEAQTGTVLSTPLPTPQPRSKPSESETTIAADSTGNAKPPTSEHSGTKVVPTGEALQPASNNMLIYGGVITVLVIIVAFFNFVVFDGSENTETLTVDTVTATNAPTNTVIATDAPTDIPTKIATEAPTETPTDVATDAPTDIPTEIATDAPTIAPTETPTNIPSPEPSSPCEAFALLESSFDASSSSLDCGIFHTFDRELLTHENLASLFDVQIVTDLRDECAGTDGIVTLNNPFRRNQYSTALQELNEELECENS